jgi:hypothetical protein
LEMRTRCFMLRVFSGGVVAMVVMDTVFSGYLLKESVLGGNVY